MKRIQAHIHAATIEVTMKRAAGDDPLSDDAQLKALLPAKAILDSIKKAEATRAERFSLLEFFAIAEGAARVIPVGDGSDLIKKRRILVKKAGDALISMGDRKTAKSGELKDLIDGYDAAVELHANLPEWAFLQSGLDLMKQGLREGGILKRKRK